jgi:hypothetical protein
MQLYNQLMMCTISEGYCHYRLSHFEGYSPTEARRNGDFEFFYLDRLYRTTLDAHVILQHAR